MPSSLGPPGWAPPAGRAPGSRLWNWRRLRTLRGVTRFSEPGGYRQPGPMTALAEEQIRFTEDLPDDPVRICAAVQRLVIQPHDAIAAGVPESRLAEKNIRPVSRQIEVLAGLDPAPLSKPRPPAGRVVGTCRDFALLSCALLRLRGIPARARCGFGTYFQPGKNLDHWVTEYQAPGQRRWTRIDAEILGSSLVSHPDDLAPGEFLTGGEAWAWYRTGTVDGQSFGVPGTTHAWGPAEIRGNAIRDLAALCTLEMLPWDEWGRMEASYAGKTGPDYDLLIDEIAATCASDDPATISRLYATEDLAVPDNLIA